jgi:tRNA-specific 2-thiouridylase
LSKDETRALAQRFDLPVAAKPDSQDICFVPNGAYAAVVATLRPGAAEPGEIVHVDGRALGRHAGIIHYTVGQRRGLGLGGGDQLYVVRLEPEMRRVVVGPRAALAVPALTVRELNWLGDAPLDARGFAAEVKIRSASPPAAAKIYAAGEGRARVVFDRAQEGVAPGQACVMYSGERVLGGGWIERGTAPHAREAAAALCAL